MYTTTILSFLFFTVSSLPVKEELVNLSIVHINDFHARYQILNEITSLLYLDFKGMKKLVLIQDCAKVQTALEVSQDYSL